ncbi:MAG TPA: glycosyltransferase family 4 protein [Methylomirabilota bacterium]|nr:glycosyltransferase family 4 protein [Methylomirabilota bacterium]
MGPTKILFITRKWPPAVGGMETYCFELVAELERLTDLDVRALPGGADGSAPHSRALVRFGIREAWHLVTGAGGFNVIHGGDMAIWPLALIGKFRSRRSAIVLSAHGTDVAYAGRSGVKAALYRTYMRLGSRLARSVRVIANSGATAERVRALGFRQVDIVPLATRAHHSAEPATPPTPSVLFAGRLVRRKGLSWFVANVLPGLPDGIALKVAGTVWDEAERRALDAVRVAHLGTLPQAELASVMAEAICVVVPNVPVGRGHFEGFGLVAVEAAAVGGVVLASRLDGLTDAVIDGETGFLLPAADAAAWIAKIGEIAAWSEAERTAFRETARRRCAEVYAWSRVARQTLAVYRSELARKEPAE